MLQDILEIHKNMEATVRNVIVIITDSWLAVTAWLEVREGLWTWKGPLFSLWEAEKEGT